MSHDWRLITTSKMDELYLFKCRNCNRALETYEPDPDSDQTFQAPGIHKWLTCEELVAADLHAS